MAYGVGDPKKGCAACTANVAACNSTSELPNPNQGLTGADFNGFTKRDASGNIIQQFNIVSGQFKPVDYLNILGSGESLPLFKQMIGSYKGISRLLFDYDQLLEENEGKTSFDSSFKPIFKNFADAPALPSADGQSFIYIERKHQKDPEVYVLLDTDGTDDYIVVHDGNGNPVNLDDPKYKGLFGVQTTVYITTNGSNLDTPEDPDCCAEAVWRTIVGVDSVTINGKEYPRFRLETIEDAAGNPIRPKFKGININDASIGITNTIISSLDDDYGNIYKGDAILSAFRSRNECEYVVGDANEFGDEMKVSYVQNVGGTLKFFQHELNVSYADPKGAMAQVARKVSNMNRRMVMEIARAFYLGRNRAPQMGQTFIQPLTGQQVKAGPETMGLLPALMEANFRNPSEKIITSMKDLRAGIDKAMLIVEQLVNIQQSGAVSNGDEIVMLMDRKAMTVYNSLTAEFTRLMGAQYMVTQNIKKEFVEPQLYTPYGTVSIYTCPVFEQITHNSGNILFVPRKLVMITQPENYKYDLISGTMEKSTLGFRAYDVTAPKEKATGCWTYDVAGNFAIILGLVDSGAYRWIQNVH